MSVLLAQWALSARGFDPGQIDGIMGRKTAAAVRAFQGKHGLSVTGVLDRATLSALLGNRAPMVTPLPWIEEAKRVMGMHELRDKPRLMAWLRSDGATLGDPAQHPWCGDFVQTAIALGLPDEPIPANPYGSINWLKFGRATEPQFGAVLVFWRGTPGGWQGHVGFYLAEDATHYLVLGGNQSNAVTEARIAKGRLRPGGARWPSTFADPKQGATRRRIDGVAATTNEA
ncbi:MAG: hypothetical protein AUK37_01635 [Rhodobacterales bacterium CG2_30_65_12]|nr:MAG: hypothetical protein AUK37_01635 [Rhodobacterales bacterium CG2_30_65_12]